MENYQAELRKQQRTLQRQLNVTLEADSRLNLRVTQALLESRTDLERLNAEACRSLARFEKKTRVDPALVLSSLPLVSLYGRHNTQHHLTLVIVLAIWLFGDEVTELLSSPRSEGAPAPVRSDFWLYLSPVANLVAGWWLLHERQHEPYITGTASEFERVPRSRREREETAPLRRALEHARSALLPCLPPCLREGRQVERYRAVVELAPYVAKDFELDLVGLTEPPSLATVSGITWSAGAERRTPRVEAIAAWVEVGKLYLTLTVSAGRGPRRGRPLVEQVEVAWVVKVLDEAQLSRWT